MRKREKFGLIVSAILACALALAPICAQAIGVGSVSSGGTVALYRLYNPYTGEHFYTASTEERDTLVPLGWKYEGIGWIAAEPDSSENIKPVYRLYNPYVPGGDHHYTTDENEYNELKKQGWVQEGYSWCAIDNLDDWFDVHTAVYRLYNPNATSGAHHYTTDAAERDALVDAGWRDEGIGWTAVLGRRFLFDDSQPEYVYVAAEALNVPENEPYITYSLTEEGPSKDGVVKEGMKMIAFYSDDEKMTATTYLNPDYSIDWEIFFIPWTVAW